jgi:hypothetical protein
LEEPPPRRDAVDSYPEEDGYSGEALRAPREPQDAEDFEKVYRGNLLGLLENAMVDFH